MFGKPGCDLLSVLLKSTSCFCFDPLSSCFSKEFIHSPFFSLIILLFYLSYLKRKRKKSSSRSKPSPPPPPPPVCVYSWAQAVLRVGRRLAFSCLLSGQHLLTTPGWLLGTCSSAVVYQLPSPSGLAHGNLDTICTIGMKQFGSEEKKNSQLKPIWEMSCLMLQEEKWTETRTNKFMHLVNFPRRPIYRYNLGGHRLFSLQLRKQTKEIHQACFCGCPPGRVLTMNWH